MNNKLTLAAVVLAHVFVIAGLTTLGQGCRSTSGMEGQQNLSAFNGYPGPGETGASGYTASVDRSRTAPQPVAIVATQPPSAVVEPVGAPGTEVAPPPAPASEPGLAESTKPVAETSAEPKAVGAGRTYVVKRNESLWIIAKREGVTRDELVAANNLNLNAKLREGQKLVIPPSSGHKSVSHTAAGTAAKAHSAATSGEMYVVKKGDSLSVIAHKLGTTTAALRAENGGKDSIYEGQKLKVPAGAKHASGAVVTAEKTSSGSVATVAEKTGVAPAPGPVTPASAAFQPVPLMGGAVAPAPGPATAPAPESVDATPVTR